MKRKKIYHEHDTPAPDDFPEISSVASVNECTGLLHRTPTTDSELEHLQELSPMAIPPKK